MSVYSRLLASKLAWMLTRKQFKIFFIALLLLIFSIGALQQRIQMLLRKSDPLHLEAQKLLQKQLQPDVEHNLTQLSFHSHSQLSLHSHSQLEDTELKQPQTMQQNLLDNYSRNVFDTAVKQLQTKQQNLLDNNSPSTVLDSPRLSSVQQWPHGIRYAP